jgi:hypothetical protein
MSILAHLFYSIKYIECAKGSSNRFLSILLINLLLPNCEISGRPRDCPFKNTPPSIIQPQDCGL